MPILQYTPPWCDWLPYVGEEDVLRMSKLGMLVPYWCLADAWLVRLATRGLSQLRQRDSITLLYLVSFAFTLNI